MGKYHPPKWYSEMVFVKILEMVKTQQYGLNNGYPIIKNSFQYQIQIITDLRIQIEGKRLNNYKH